MKYGYIVEGFNDELKIMQTMPDAYVVVTQGTRMNNRVRMDIRKAIEQCDVVCILTDPDEAGDLLAEMIRREFPTLQRIRLDRDKCLGYKPNRIKVGVEHCDDEYLKDVLSAHIM